MKKKNRRFGDTEDDLSAGRVEYLEKARRRVRARRMRRTVAAVVVLAALVAYVTGAVGTSIVLVQDTLDSARIALLPAQSYPQQTGLFTLYQVEPLSGGFVALGEEGCVVYADSGHKLNSIQTGYARPAIAAGKNRFVLYNRSGNELRVESRTQNLYVKTMENNIFLCAVGDGGQVAVVTEDVRHVAVLTIYSAMMEEQLRWSMTSTEGTPVRLAFAGDGRRLAVAAVTTANGQALANLYVVDTRRDDPVYLGAAEGSLPLWVGWLSGSEVLAVFDDHAAVYAASGGEKARYDFPDETVASLSADENGAALLFRSGQTCSALVLDKRLNVQFHGGVPAAEQIVRSADAFYLLSDSGVSCFSLAGEYQWAQPQETRPQKLLAGSRLLLFSSNAVQLLTPPAEPQPEN